MVIPFSLPNKPPKASSCTISKRYPKKPHWSLATRSTAFPTKSFPTPMSRWKSRNSAPNIHSTFRSAPAFYCITSPPFLNPNPEFPAFQWREQSGCESPVSEVFSFGRLPSLSFSKASAASMGIPCYAFFPVRSAYRAAGFARWRNPSVLERRTTQTNHPPWANTSPKMREAPSFRGASHNIFSLNG